MNIDPSAGKHEAKQPNYGKHEAVNNKSSRLSCSIEPTFPLHTQYYTTPDRSELIIFTFYNTQLNNSDKYEMTYYRIGSRGMYELIDETQYAIPLRTISKNNTSSASAAAASASNSAASASSSAASSSNNITNENGKIILEEISEDEFKKIYKNKHISSESSSFSSLLQKERKDKITLPEEDPLNILHTGYRHNIFNTDSTTNTIIDELVTFLPIHYIFDDISEANRPDITYEYNPNQKPTSLEKLLIDNPSNHEFQAIYGIMEFLRSYIDMYHDFLHYGTAIISQLKHIFENYVLFPYYLDKIQDPLKDKLHKFYHKWIKKIDTSIFTSSGRVIQPACHNIIEEIADEYIKLLYEIGIKWMPNSKTNAFIGTYSLNNDCDITNLVAQLHADGINDFYIESANSHIGKSLSSKGMRVATIDVGEWDAGSGYGSFKKRTVNTVIGTRNISTKASNKKEKKSYLLPSSLPPPIILFGHVKISMEDEYKTIVIQNILDSPNKQKENAIRINGENKDGYTQLSLNRVATTLGLPTIRGEGEATKLNTIPKVLTPNQQLLVATLKTWTDYVQIKTLSFLKSIAIPKIGMVINDKCCETSARINGLGCVLKNEGSNITYYSYDINSRQMSLELLNKKRRTLLQILEHVDELEAYITKWFDIRITTLNQIKSFVPDPVLYFCSLLFNGVYITQKEKALKEISQLKLKKTNSSKTNELKDMIKGFPVSVSEWLQSITNSESIYSDFINEINNLRNFIKEINKYSARDREKIITYSDSLKQIITNSLGKKITNENQLRILVSTTFAFILFKKPRPEQYIKTFNSILYTPSRSIQLTDDQKALMEYSLKILSELLKHPSTNIWKISQKDFQPINSQNTHSTTISSFKNIYLTPSNDKLTYLSNFQTYSSNSPDVFLHYGFEGIYYRAMCMLLDTHHLPQYLTTSASCIASKINYNSNNKPVNNVQKTKKRKNRPHNMSNNNKMSGGYINKRKQYTKKRK